MDNELFLLNQNIRWLKFYELAKIYYNHHGDLNIMARFKTINGYEEDEMGENLGEWIRTQRKAYKKGKLNEEKIKLLERIGACLEGIHEFNWNQYYKLAKIYFDYYGNLDIPSKFATVNGYEYNDKDKDTVYLGGWISIQRKAYKKGKLSEKRKRLLEEIGINIEKTSYDEWYRKYNLAKIYYEYHGDLNIKVLFKTVNGYEYDEKGDNLGQWLRNQRIFYQKGSLSQEKIKLLEKIGAYLENIPEFLWNQYYKLAKIYFEHYGNLDVPRNFTTINGYEFNDEDKDTVYLGGWISIQRKAYKKGKLSEKRKRLLEEIGINIEKTSYDEWYRKYNLAKIYYEYHGNLNVHRDFVTINGFEYNNTDKEAVSLGRWIHTQREVYKKGKLSEEKIHLLEKIGMKFILFDRDDNWRKNYELVKIFYNYHGHLNIPADFKTINGYEYDEKGYSLGIWFNKQRVYYTKGKMPQERLELFQHICDFETNNPLQTTSYLTWNGFYELAKNFFQYHQHLKIPIDFKTINGYERSESGYELGRWIQLQKEKYLTGALSEDRYNKFVLISMIWDIKDNGAKIIKVFNWLRINHKINEDILINVPYPEFLAKLKYLIYNNIPVQKDGKLHEIFSLNNKNMQLKYGINLEELLYNFYFPKKIGKSRTLNK